MWIWQGKLLRHKEARTMSHGRHDYPTAIHLLRVRGRAGNAIFFPAELLRQCPENAREHAPDLRFWESLVVRVCDRYDAKVHGYTWLPNETILLLQRFAAPLRIILASLVGQYSRHLHDTGRVPPGESPYLCRCESIEVTPELLPYAVRSLYARAVKAGLCASPSEYPFCTHNLHFAESVPPWFETQEFLARVRMRGHVGRASVEQFLAKPESQRHAAIFGRLSARTPLIAGEAADIYDAVQLAKHSLPAPSVEQVAAVVATLLSRESRSPDRVLAAALTTWYATRTGAATLAQMGRHFDREPTTLRADIESHRKTTAALFGLTFEKFLALSRAHAPATAGLRVASRPDVSRVPESAGDTNMPEGRRAAGEPKTSHDGIRVMREAQRRGGRSSTLASSEFAPACMISNEDVAGRGAPPDLELTVVGRRTRKGRGD
jgi:hypothetical protein